VLVLRLLLPEEGEEAEGLLAEVAHGEEREMLPLSDIETAEGDPAAGVLEDYYFWLENAPEDDLVPREGPPSSSGAHPRSATLPARAGLWSILLEWALYAAGGGAALGAVLKTVHGADTGVSVGAVLLALVGLVVGRLMGMEAGLLNRIRSFRLVGSIFGALAGATVGALVGALVVAFVGSILGSITGTLVGRVLAALRWKPLSLMGWTILGALTGAVVWACYLDQDRALAGALWGALLAPVAVAFLIVVFLVTVFFVLGPPPSA
jgi:hypothetical protein